jgi:hypothetical protein
VPLPAPRTLSRRKLAVGSGLGDAAMLEHQDSVGVTQGRKPARDDEGRALPHHFVERRMNFHFGRGVERAGRFVENQDRRIFEQRACD